MTVDILKMRTGALKTAYFLVFFQGEGFVKDHPTFKNLLLLLDWGGPDKFGISGADKFWNMSVW